MIDDDRAWFSAIDQAVGRSEFANRFNQPMRRQHLLSGASNSRRRMAGCCAAYDGRNATCVTLTLTAVRG
jgi:hypothetical protein